MEPKVTFVVPCYKLAHLLPECVNSILKQTYKDLEVLIMDDCSPDTTPEVAQSFNDPRVRHIRNEPNLGHLSNYNKGIGLAAGKYVWLISADDRISKPYALERYVQIMERHPRLGYVFSAGRFLENGRETRLIEDSWWGNRDRIFSGHDFFVRLYRGDANIVCPSCMVRKDCYTNVGMFPLDMPHAGDRYLWSLWALTYDVAYFAEPMVSYRLHDLNIMNSLRQSKRVMADMFAWQSRIRIKAQEVDRRSLTRTWLSNVSNLYAYALLSEHFQNSSHRMTFDEFESSLREIAAASEQRAVRARVYATFADGCYVRGELGETLRYYRRSLGQNRWMPRIWGKYLLLRSGRLGVGLRRLLVGLRQSITRRRRISPLSAS
jgi:glycosyltransferase involved in cell wall biosynthesis